MEGERKSSLIRCVYCNKEIAKEDVIRYRGAVSCNSCAVSQPSKKEYRLVYILAGIGCLIGLFNIAYTLTHELTYSPLFPDSYIPALEVYLSGMAFSLFLQSMGLYFLNRNYNRIMGILTAITGAISGILHLAALLDVINFGYYYIINDQVRIKNAMYYQAPLGTFSLFSLLAAIGILLYLSSTKTETITIATAGMYLLMGSLVVFAVIIPPFGFVTMIAFTTTSVFFFSRYSTEKENHS